MNRPVSKIIIAASIFVLIVFISNIRDIPLNQSTALKVISSNQSQNNKINSIKEPSKTTTEKTTTDLTNAPKISNTQEETKSNSKKPLKNNDNNFDKSDKKNVEKTKAENLLSCDNSIGQENCIFQITKGENIFVWNGRTILISELFNKDNVLIDEENNSNNKEISQTSIWHKDQRLNLWSAWNYNQAKNLPSLNYLEHNNKYVILSDENYKLKIVTPNFKIPKSLKNKRIVAYYGYPEEPRLGILGELDQKELIERINNDIYDLQVYSKDKDVLGALHIIVAVAQDKETNDGTYLERIPTELLDRYINFAEQNNLLVFLDIQIGWANIIDEIKIIEKYLKKNYVHLALDPEYATGNQKMVPGKIIGSVSGAEINAAQDYLNQIIMPETDYKKTLMIHRFNTIMINNEDDIIDYKNIELSIDMDGFGNKSAKKTNYDIFALKSYSEIPAIKLFYDWDTPLFTNKELMEFTNPPNIIIYQ